MQGSVNCVLMFCKVRHMHQLVEDSWGLQTSASRHTAFLPWQMSCLAKTDGCMLLTDEFSFVTVFVLGPLPCWSYHIVSFLVTKLLCLVPADTFCINHVIWQFIKIDIKTKLISKCFIHLKYVYLFVVIVFNGIMRILRMLLISSY